MANKRIHDLDDTATTLDSGAYFAVDSDSYTAAKKFAADSLQTAVDIGGLTPTDGNFIVGDGSAWVAESGATALASIGAAAASHTHGAGDITSGTLVHERGGLEADVSAYAGLVKISGGSTSAVTVTAFGESLIDDADAATARTTLGVVIGTDVQAHSDNLDDIAAITPSSGQLLGANGTWGAVTPSSNPGTTADVVLKTGTSGLLQLAQLGIGGSPVASEPLSVIGANGEIRITSTTTDSANKFGRVTVRHYTNTEEPALLLNVTSTSTQTLLSFGGGSSVTNTVTNVDFYAAANTTTLTGTKKVAIDANGMAVGDALAPSADAQLYVRSNSDTKAAIMARDNSASTTDPTIEIVNSSIQRKIGLWAVNGRAVFGSIGAGNTLGHVRIENDDATSIPVLYLAQNDVSEDFFEFKSTVGEGNAIEAVGAKTLTVTHYIKCTINGVGERYIALGTIA